MGAHNWRGVIFHKKNIKRNAEHPICFPFFSFIHLADAFSRLQMSRRPFVLFITIHCDVKTLECIYSNAKKSSRTHARTYLSLLSISVKSTQEVVFQMHSFKHGQQTDFEIIIMFSSTYWGTQICKTGSFSHAWVRDSSKRRVQSSPWTRVSWAWVKYYCNKPKAK